MSEPSMRDRILDAAERRARTAGYGGFSFRELAGDVGVKSASVHYHFRTKADLGEALARRYAERARAKLGDPAGLSPDEAIGRMTEVFRYALLVEDRMCLCGLFGAERDALPPAVNAEVAGFFKMALAWLETALGDDSRFGRPAAILARLEGALILARSIEDPALFDEATAFASDP